MDLIRGWLTQVDATRTITAAVLLAAILLARRYGRQAAGRYIADNDLRYTVRKVITFATTLLAVLGLIVVYTPRMSGFTVAFGVAGAGIAFALQEVIASVAGWVAVLFGGFYSTGDRVQLGGIKGDVIDIGVLRTTLMECGVWVDGDLYNGRIVRVANSFVFKEPVVNYTSDFPFLWDEIKLPVRYGSDRALTRSLLLEIVTDVSRSQVTDATAAWRDMVRKYRIEDARLDPMVQLIATDNWIEYTVRYVVDYRQRRATKDALFSRILDAVDGSQGRIRLASATFELVDAPRFEVTVAPAPT